MTENINVKLVRFLKLLVFSLFCYKYLTYSSLQLSYISGIPTKCKALLLVYKKIILNKTRAHSICIMCVNNYDWAYDKILIIH